MCFESMYVRPCTTAYNVSTCVCMSVHLYNCEYCEQICEYIGVYACICICEDVLYERIMLCEDVSYEHIMLVCECACVRCVYAYKHVVYMSVNILIRECMT